MIHIVKGNLHMNWLKLPPLSALRAFSAFSETGSVAQAGAMLNVSHAAISQQLRNLEGFLGVSLLDRSNRAMSLTMEGRLLAEALSDGFSRIAETVDALKGAEEARPLHINTTASFAANWLMPRISGFREVYPEKEIMISASPELVTPGKGGIDATIRYGSGNWAGFCSEPLVASPMVAVAAPSLIDGNLPDRPEDLLEYPWLQELGTSESSAWLIAHGVTGARVGNLMHLPGNLMLDAVRGGQGIAITARIWVENDIKDGRLISLFENARDAGYHLVYPHGDLRPSVRTLLTWLRREARK